MKVFAGSTKCQLNRVGPVGYADAVVDVGELGVCLFELANRLTPDERGGSEDLVQTVADLVVDLPLLGGQINEGDVHEVTDFLIDAMTRSWSDSVIWW
jgi:hypothetical protein